MKSTLKKTVPGSGNEGERGQLHEHGLFKSLLRHACLKVAVLRLAGTVHQMC